MDTSVLMMLDRASKNHFDKVAYRNGEESLTFGELRKLTKAVGSWIARKLPPESPVSVLAGRSVITPVCYMGAVQAGCFYAPMDSAMPIARLNQILKVINSEIMLVSKDNLELANSLEYKGKIVAVEDILDTEADEALLASAVNNLTEYSPLYAIFTSGSSGVPKGVITSHHSLLCYLDGLNEVLGLTEEDILANQSPLDYIAAVRDIYLPLMTFAETVIVPKNEFAMGAQLFETLNKYKVSTICWSAAGMEVPAKLGAFEEVVPEYLNKIVFSGSVFPGKYLKIWQENLPKARFINQYGPTEATASCTYYEVKEKVTEETVLSIGKPYKHYGILLLDEENNAVPEGKEGEICVKGPCLALGYYGDAERTEKSFIQNPLNKNYRELIYKTGDLGRIEADGNLTFIGRKDRQIKHMGHRVELAELELTALALEGVEECCVLYHADKKHLYMFVAGRAESKDIVLHFRKVMPPFMVPRKVIKLEEMPKLPNGKTDMQKLKIYFK
ncbi:MAG: AMP-binding protein [Hornefia sp.]|nr:AMP-binding protein [Hornefia sp.]